jgi:hypothetical protein
MNAFEKLKALIAETEKDANSFYAKGNKAAGVRLRKAFQQIKGLAQDGRNEVSELKKKAE